MENLNTFVARQWEISKRQHGLQRSANAVAYEATACLREVQGNSDGLYGWVDVILAGIEGGLRSGQTPYALAQALMNRQTEIGARKMPPALPHAP